MKDDVKLIVAAVAGAILIAAFGLHAKQLAALPKPTGQALQGVIGTSETGKA